MEKIKLYFVSTLPLVQSGERRLRTAWLIAQGVDVMYSRELGLKPWQRLKDELTRHGLFEQDKASRLHIFLTEYYSGFIQSEILLHLRENGFKEDAPMFSILLAFIKGGAHLYGADGSTFMILKHQLQDQANWGQDIDPQVIKRALDFRNNYVAQHICANVPPGELALFFVSTLADQMLFSEPFRINFDITTIKI